MSARNRNEAPPRKPSRDGIGGKPNVGEVQVYLLSMLRNVLYSEMDILHILPDFRTEKQGSNSTTHVGSPSPNCPNSSKMLKLGVQVWNNFFP